MTKELLPFKIVVAVLGVVLLYAMIGTERFWVLHDRPVIAHMTTIAGATESRDLVSELDDYGVHVARQPSKFEQFMLLYKLSRGIGPEPASFDHMTAPSIGYSIREIGFFGMPFGWYKEYGDVLYVHNDWGDIYSNLTDKGLAEINKANGRDVTKGNLFPFWNHMWGWFWVAGLGLAWWLWHRAQVRRREALGLID